jgi:hypothetical protein
MDERLDAFLNDVLALEGGDSNMIREGVRIHLAVYEKQFWDAEPDKSKRNEAAQNCRDLCRKRVVEEMERFEGTPTADLLRLARNVIDGEARFPLKDI